MDKSNIMNAHIVSTVAGESVMPIARKTTHILRSSKKRIRKEMPPPFVMSFLSSSMRRKDFSKICAWNILSSFLNLRIFSMNQSSRRARTSLERKSFMNATRRKPVIAANATSGSRSWYGIILWKSTSTTITRTVEGMKSIMVSMSTMAEDFALPIFGFVKYIMSGWPPILAMGVIELMKFPTVDMYKASLNDIVLYFDDMTLKRAAYKNIMASWHPTATRSREMLLVDNKRTTTPR